MIPDVANTVLALAARYSSTALAAAHILRVLPSAHVPDVLRSALAAHHRNLVLSAIQSPTLIRVCPRIDLKECMTHCVYAAVSRNDKETLEWLVLQVVPPSCSLHERALCDALRAAAQHGHMPLVTWLWSLIPHLEYDIASVTLLQLASEHSQLNVLDWWWDNYHQMFALPGALSSICLRTGVVQSAPSAGRFKVLQWWIERDPRTWTIDVVWRAIYSATYSGHSDIRDWLVSQSRAGRFGCGDPFGVDASFLECEFRKAVPEIIKDDRADMLAWWWTHCSVTLQQLETSIILGDVKLACEHGAISVLEWYRQHYAQPREEGIPPLVDLKVLGFETYATSLPVLNWAYAKGYLHAFTTMPETLRPAIVALAVREPDLLSRWETAQALPSIPVDWILQIAALTGRVDLFDTGYSRLGPTDFPSTKPILKLATIAGRVPILQWCWTHRDMLPFRPSSHLFDLAASNRQLPALQWWHRWWRSEPAPLIAFDLQATTAHALSRSGDTEILQWWFQNVYPTSTTSPRWLNDAVLGKCLGAAIANAHLSTVNMWTALCVAHGRPVAVSDHDFRLESMARLGTAVDIMMEVQRSFPGIVYKASMATRRPEYVVPSPACCTFAAKVDSISLIRGDWKSMFHRGMYGYHQHCHDL
ncbi:hypothetical protein BC828DRAFT_418368 [Blastocladiella britannica]|nr:hypothetical protein BC828DRAFT_418368 [Blastocladiella britannica]